MKTGDPNKLKIRVSEEKNNQLEFLYELHLKGVPIGQDNVTLLTNAGYIKPEKPAKLPDVKAPKIKKFGKKIVGKASKLAHEAKDEADLKASEHVTIVRGSGDDENEIQIFTEKEYEEKLNEKEVIHIGKKISKSDWMPESVTEHRNEFVKWVDSILFDGFQNKIPYLPFLMYCQQAENFAAVNEHREDFYNTYDIIDFEDREIERCSQNSLYFLNKYLKLKESNMATGTRDYIAVESHKVLCFLSDCGYTFMLGKPRQIAATSTLGGIAVHRLIFNRNFFIKFITQADKKGKEIFTDKIQWPFTQIPEWMRPDVMNDRGDFIQTGKKTGKGQREGVGSKLEVEAPTPTAISGGTPSLVMIDEIGNIPIFTDIIEDGRPTMFWMNPQTKKLEMKRQCIFWGTGGEQTGKGFQAEFTGLVNQWKERDFSPCIVPIFFDWTTRPGIDKEQFEKEKKVYYSKTGPGAESSKIKFHQQYPEKIQDMFLASHKTLVSQDYINQAMERIRVSREKLQPKYGYFEPIYGNIEQQETSDVPYDVVGANFVPTEGKHDPRTTATIYFEPKPGWKHRYYQGTDPIASDNGVSKMASSIWDQHYKTKAAHVNFRSSNYKEVFLQCLLLGLYYDSTGQGKGVKELLESNIGLTYREYKETKGFDRNLVFNTELPPYLQVHNGTLVGIDNRRGVRNKMIIDKMFEMEQAYGQRMFCMDRYEQLSTFVCLPTKSGGDTWGPIDKRTYFDDVLFSDVYSYICALCYSHLVPLSDSMAKIGELKKVRYKTTYDKNYNLIRVPVIKKG